MVNKKQNKYVALLRGIMPTNPSMRNENLRAVLEELGFTGVKTVIASGNVIFESDSGDTKQLEEIIEKAWPEKLGFTSTTIIRKIEQLISLTEADPFRDHERTENIRLNVTFLKKDPAFKPDFPYQVEGRSFTLLAMSDRAVFSVIDISAEKTPDMMTWLEKQYGKDITTRTWKTVHRILEKMES